MPMILQARKADKYLTHAAKEILGSCYLMASALEASKENFTYENKWL